MYHRPINFVCHSKACRRGSVQLLWCRVSFTSVHSRCSGRAAALDSVCTVTGRMQSSAEALRLMRWHRRVNDSHNSQVKLAKSTQSSWMTSRGSCQAWCAIFSIDAGVMPYIYTALQVTCVFLSLIWGQPCIQGLSGILYRSLPRHVSQTSSWCQSGKRKFSGNRNSTIKMHTAHLNSCN